MLKEIRFGVLIKLAETRIDKPRYEERHFRVPRPAHTLPFERQTEPYSLAPRRVTGKSARHLVSSGPL